MEKIVINGTTFTTFAKDGEQYLCTGSPTSEFEFWFAGDINDHYKVVGATSVVAGRNKTVDQLYAEWLEVTRFSREVLGIEF